MVLTFYADEHTKTRMETIRFPTTRAGQKSTIGFFVRNDYSAPIELANPQTNDKDLDVSVFPKQLYSGESGPVAMTFAPQAERTEPLNAQISFEVTIG